MDAVEIDDGAAQLGERIGDLGAEPDQQQLGGGVGGDVGKLAASRFGVDRHDRHSGLERADHGHGGLDPGLGNDRDPTRAGQLRGYPARRRRQLRVGQ